MAQSEYVEVTIPVRDAVTRTSLNNDRHRVKFEICSVADSTAITESLPVFSLGEDPSAMMECPGGNYLLKVMVYDTSTDADGRSRRNESSVFEPMSWHNISIPAEGGRRTVSPIYISRKREKQLQEVSVTATKVMFYHKGDTLIYNADAFILPQGSMLDALIEQMPGVRISANGVIYCNGRKIDNLLLNGKDLFNGNQKLMLENLGAYTIKDIAVYDKKGHLSEMFDENMGDELHVMDVRLKREYQHGYILNLEGGYGTHKRYLARLFGMWFIDNLSFTAYGNVNNVDDKGTPGRDDSAWSYNQSGNGVTTIQTGGVSYFFQGVDSNLELKGDVGVKHSEIFSRTAFLCQNYFSTGDVFSYNHTQIHDRNFSVKTGHSFFFKADERVMFNFLPKFEYAKVDKHSNGIDASLSEELHNVSMDLLSSIYENAEEYWAKIIYRSRTESQKRNNKIEGSIEAKTDIKLNSALQSPFLLSLKGNVFLNSVKSDYFSKHVIKEQAMDVPYYNENRYTKGNPTHKEIYSGMAELSKWLSYSGFSGVLKFNYAFDRTNDEVTSSMYLLNLIPGYDSFGHLPSVNEYAPTYAPLNSYKTSAEYNRHRIEMKIEAAQFIISGGIPLSFWAQLPIDIHNRHFLYDGRGVYDKITRNDYIVNGAVGVSCFLPKRYYVQLGMRTEGTPNNMIDLVSVKDDDDPLNVFTGNPDLLNPRKYRVDLQFKKDKITSNHALYLNWETTHNAIALGYLYNPESGVRTGRMLNIDGNWRTQGSYEYYTHFGSFGRPRLSTITSGMYQRSVDYYGTQTQDDISDIPLRTVNTITTKEDVRLDWQTGKHRFSAFGDVRFNRFQSKDFGFRNFSSWNFNVGATAIINLPHDWGISTDLALHTRRGYADSRLNTTDLIWNARLSKSILKGSVMFLVDGYDLLHQLSNINYTVNAQARTETVTNVIPSYVMFHIRWNFNQQPKR